MVRTCVVFLSHSRRSAVLSLRLASPLFPFDAAVWFSASSPTFRSLAPATLPCSWSHPSTITFFASFCVDRRPMKSIPPYEGERRFLASFVTFFFCVPSVLPAHVGVGVVFLALLHFFFFCQFYFEHLRSCVCMHCGYVFWHDSFKMSTSGDTSSAHTHLLAFVARLLPICNAPALVEAKEAERALG